VAIAEDVARFAGAVRVGIIANFARKTPTARQSVPRHELAGVLAASRPKQAANGPKSR
jgi:hypothetical protein